MAVGGGRSTLEGKGTHTTNKGEEDWGEGGFLTQPRSPGGRWHLSRGGLGVEGEPECRPPNPTQPPHAVGSKQIFRKSREPPHIRPGGVILPAESIQPESKEETLQQDARCWNVRLLAGTGGPRKGQVGSMRLPAPFPSGQLCSPLPPESLHWRVMLHLGKGLAGQLTSDARPSLSFLGHML